MARNLFADIVVSLLFVLAIALWFFKILSVALTTVFVFVLLFVALLDFSNGSLPEEPSKKYLEREKKKELLAKKRQIIDALVQRIDVMIEKVKYLKLLMKGGVLVLE